MLVRTVMVMRCREKSLTSLGRDESAEIKLIESERLMYHGREVTIKIASFEKYLNLLPIIRQGLNSQENNLMRVASSGFRMS